MQTRKFWSFALLIAFTFSLIHEYAYSKQEHCTIQGYVQEFTQPAHHGDICDTHFVYHATYILPDQIKINPQTKESERLILEKKIQLSEPIFGFYRPPAHKILS